MKSVSPRQRFDVGGERLLQRCLAFAAAHESQHGPFDLEHRHDGRVLACNRRLFGVHRLWWRRGRLARVACGPVSREARASMGSAIAGHTVAALTSKEVRDSVWA
ncbi:MAG: hypothetical protein O9345_02175 [Burkholderiaceae bacterium]|nr:hypothetical protein [Burkholderiales bacterium]MCZ8336958.1 hypothetical protein [Burkholderiaceae bacterium]